MFLSVIMILIFSLVSLLMFFIPSLVSMKAKKLLEKFTPYECGFDSIKSNRLPFSLQFFLVATVFLVFDVEICLMLPLIFNTSMSYTDTYYFLLQVFLIILLLGILHEWNQGVLDWKN